MSLSKYLRSLLCKAFPEPGTHSGKKKKVYISMPLLSWAELLGRKSSLIITLQLLLYVTNHTLNLCQSQPLVFLKLSSTASVQSLFQHQEIRISPPLPFSSLPLLFVVGYDNTYHLFPLFFFKEHLIVMC